MTRSWWGWGREDEHLSRDELTATGALLAQRFGVPPPQPRAPARVADLDVPARRITAPRSLEHVVDADPEVRARHAHGNSFRDVTRAFRGELTHYPDLVALPADEDEVAAVLDWCDEAGAACIPFGGGTSVVGGVNPPGGERPVVTLDLGRLDAVLEVDEVSRAAEIQAGALGPAIEDALRPRGLTLRHFPQSWEFSSLGGWLATRAGGHYATHLTHIDDLTEAISAVTPAGRWRSRRLPGSGAGPSPDRMLLGSEGTLGVITSAWMRVQARPRHRAQAAVTFERFGDGLDAVRALAQSGLYPANCRLLDPVEALLAGAGDGSASVLVLGFESADHALGPAIARALELTADHGGRCPDGARIRDGGSDRGRDGGPAASDAWRRSFLRAPYLRDGLVALGMVVETFETAITWDRAEAFVTEITTAARTAAEAVCGRASVSVRVTHAYPDGVAPYVTVIAPGRDGSQVAMWDEIKAAASEAVLAGGGTITHHHAVGRDHRPWYDRQRPDPFAAALRAAKAELDPRGLLNPGVLLDP